MHTSLTRLSSAVLVVLFCASGASAEPLQEVAAWNILNFAGGANNPQDSVITGVTAAQDRLFVSMPRVRANSAMTLGWIPRWSSSGTINPPIVPFPDWSWQSGQLNNCSGLVSVFRTRLDKCGRLWVLDSGTVDTSTRVCPARIFVFDLKNGVLDRLITIPFEVIRPTSVLTFLVLDQSPHAACDDMHVYISDTLGYGLIVHNVARGGFWRVEHQTLRNEPQLGTFQIQNEQGMTQDGILGMAISYIGQERMLFYHAFSSLNMYAVSTAALQVPNTPISPVSVLQKNSQGVCMVSDRQGNILFSPLSETNIVEFNPGSLQATELHRNPRALQFVADMNIDEEGAIWLVSNKFQRFSSNSYDNRDLNQRIMRIPPRQPFSVWNLSNYFSLF